jgi:transcriptional regulator with XRE-family HTH domain
MRPAQITPGLVDPARARTLRDRRRAQGLKLSELALLLGVSISHLSNVEYGTRAPSPDLLARAGRALGCEAAAIEPAPQKAA